MLYRDVDCFFFIEVMTVEKQQITSYMYTYNTRLFSESKSSFFSSEKQKKNDNNNQSWFFKSNSAATVTADATADGTIISVNKT